MRIKKISLKNGYKRFRDLTIDLGDNPPKIVALIGPNGCGKSSVFDGMLYKANVHARIGQFDPRDFSYHSMDGSPNYNHNNIFIEFGSGNFQNVFNNKKSEGKQNTIFNFRNSYRFNSNLKISNLQSIPDIKLNSFGASTSSDLDDKMTINYQRLYTYLNKYRRSRGLTDAQAQAQVIGELNSVLESCLDLTISSEGDIVDGKGTLFFKKRDQATQFDFNVLSAGEKEVVDILLDLFLKKEEFNDSIYLIDEPELHINTSIQKKLLIEIEKIIPDTCQIWVATHSIGFLNALQTTLNSKCEIIHFKGDYAREAITLRPIAKTRQNWKEIFQIALDDLTGLLAPRTIIYCEGRKDPGVNGEDQGFDAKVYNQIFGKEYPEVLFLSSGGQTEPDKYSEIALTILGKAFDGVEINILKDKDIRSDGTLTTDADRTAYLSQDQKRRMLKRRELENYILDYDIVSATFPNYEQTSYDALITDIENGDTKLVVGQLMSAVGQNSGLNKDQFKLKLAEKILPGTTIYNLLKECIFQTT